jgi:hypothetical protein
MNANDKAIIKMSLFLRDENNYLPEGDNTPVPICNTWGPLGKLR